jgi:hypothetical protein
MVTRRTLLKQGVYATLSAATLPIMERTARAQGASLGFDFYISPTGSDSNPGTLERPWTITAINSRRGDYAGKRVGLLDGTYNVHALCQAAPNSGYGTALAVNGGPRAATPTSIGAVNARQAILTGADPATGAYPTNPVAIIGQGFNQVANNGNVILDGLYITRSFGAGIGFYLSGSPSSEGGSSGVVIRNCEIFDIGGIENNNPGGIRLRFCTGTLVSNNKIHSVQPGRGQDAAGIMTFNSHSNIYEYNTIYDCNSGIYDKNDHNGNHTYRYNYIEIAGTYPSQVLTDCSGGDPGDVVTVHNNIFVGPGIWNGNGVVMPSKQSMIFHNNTCYCRSGEGGVLYLAAGSLVAPPAMVSFYNNIIYGAQVAGWAGAIRFCSGTIALSDYNVYRIDPGPRGIFGLTSPSARGAAPALYTLGAWQKATGYDSNSVATLTGSGSLFRATTTNSSLDPTSYQLSPSAVGRTMGRVGGTASGAPTEVGAWGGGATRIGCDFGPTPRSPVLSVS